MYLITFIIWAPVAAFFSIGEQGFNIARFLFIMAFPMGMHLAIDFFNKRSTVKPDNFNNRMIFEPVEYTGLTPEIKRAVDHIRRENAPSLNSYSDSQIINYISLPAIMRLADQLNNEDNEQNQEPEYIHIPEDYTNINIKGFNNIEVHNNRKNYLIKPLKQPSKNSLYSSNKPTIISKDTIISDLHLHYLLTVIDAAIGE
jgi:hypothetical protein|nr:MAG TPA: hypothetical protein [Caudoviricetes sp.]